MPGTIAHWDEGLAHLKALPAPEPAQRPRLALVTRNLLKQYQGTLYEPQATRRDTGEAHLNNLSKRAMHFITRLIWMNLVTEWKNIRGKLEKRSTSNRLNARMRNHD